MEISSFVYQMLVQENVTLEELNEILNQTETVIGEQILERILDECNIDGVPPVSEQREVNRLAKYFRRRTEFRALQPSMIEGFSFLPNDFLLEGGTS